MDTVILFQGLSCYSDYNIAGGWGQRIADLTAHVNDRIDSATESVQCLFFIHNLSAPEMFLTISNA